MLRHTLATLAYRAAKAVDGASPGFANFEPAPGTRTPAQILAHMGDLLDWAVGLVEGRHEWRNSAPLAWDAEIERFFAALKKLDERLKDAPPGYPAERLFQGPIADALTHVGQLTMLRRMAGEPIRGENYFKADIREGRSGREQESPRVEFA